MNNLEIAHRRLHNQHITRRTLETPQALVEWLGAVQAQDYAAAKWALGLRLHGMTDDNIEQAFTDGKILRTHVMRPTWHFVSPADIRWLLALTAPRVNAGNASWYRRLELDDALFIRSNAVLAKALQGGKQFTRALLDERAPQAMTLDRHEALAEVASRYFTSRGPATLQDFVWWSGLTVADARTGLEMVTSQLLYEVIDGQTYWFSSSTSPTNDLSQTVYLLPNFDEYIVGYTDRSAIFDASHTNKLDSRSNVLFQHTIVLNGRVVGTWKRTLKKDEVILTPSLFTPLTKDETHALAASAERYGEFLNMPVNVTYQ